MVVRYAVLFGMLGLFQATLGPLIPLLRDRDHLSASTAGLLVTGFFGGCLVSTAAGGVVSDRVARGPLYFASAVLLVVGMGLLALPAAWPAPLMAVAVAGLGFGGLVLMVNTAMAAKGLTHVNLVNGTYGLGAAAGPALISVTHGGPLFVVLAVGVVAALPLRPAAPVVARGHEKKLRVNPTLLLFCAMLFTYAGMETGLSAWEAVHLRAHGFAADTAAALTSLFWLGLAAGRLLAPIVTRGWSPPRILFTAFAAAGAGLGLIGVSYSAPVGFFLLGVFAGPVFPTVLTWIAATMPQPRRVNAVVLTVGMFGNAAVPAVIGYGLEATSALALPVFVGMLVACCAAIAAVLRKRALVVQDV